MKDFGKPIVGNARTSSQPWIIEIEGKAVATESPKGMAVLLFNSQELAELAIENASPKMVGAAAVQINLVTFAPACIEAGYFYATLNHYGNRFMGVLDLREVVKALQRALS